MSGSIYSVEIVGTKHILTFRKPNPLPKVGDVFVANYSFHTLANKHYSRGDTFTIIARDVPNPHGRKSTIGCLLVECKYMQSVWSEFDDGVSNGLFSLIVSSKVLS